VKPLARCFTTALLDHLQARIPQKFRFSASNFGTFISGASIEAGLVPHLSGLPSVVMKTRALLMLRGYVSTEVLEYENRYVLLPTRGVKDKQIQSLVWIFKEPRVVGIALTRELATEMEETNATEGMLVGGFRVTPAAKKFSRQNRIELVDAGYASFDLFGHDLVPHHIIADESEVKLVLNYFGITRSQLPRIRRSDAAVKLLGAKKGQVVRVHRDSPTAGQVYYYRLVSEAS
jgi:DNA-directed RNA polymerase subunit H